MDAKLAKDFHAAMLGIYKAAKARCGYNATYFLRMVNERGGLAAAHDLLAAPGISEGLQQLCMLGHLELSVEHLVQQEPWRRLFSPEELESARKRLEELKFTPRTAGPRG